MEEETVRDLESIFRQVEDPRVERTKRHRLGDIIILAICGVLCGAEGWVDIEEFGKAKEAWFTDLLDLPNGIPSHDTFGRVFALIDPKQFEASFVHWVQRISKTVKGVIAIDGKTLRRSHDHAADKIKADEFKMFLSRLRLALKNDRDRFIRYYQYAFDVVAMQVVNTEKEEREVKQRMYDWFKRVNFDTLYTSVRRSITSRERQRQRDV